MTEDSAATTQWTFADVLALLLRNRRLLLVAPMLAGLLGYAGSYLVNPTYQSTTTFIPPQPPQSSAAAALSSLGALAGIAGGAVGVKSPADQYVSFMQSVSIQDRIIDRFKLMTAYETQFKQDARRELNSMVTISLGKKDGLISVSVEDVNPRRAAEIANQYVAELRQLTSTLAVTEAQQRRLFFEKQWEQAKNKLVEAQVALERSGFNASALKAEPKAAAEAYARIRAELATAEIRLRALRTTLADRTPEVQQLSATVAGLRQRVAAQEAAAGQQPQDADYVGSFREFKYQETMFELMARQYELARVDESREGAPIQVVDVASPAERKYKPRRSVIAALSAIGMFILLLAGILLREITSPGRGPGSPSTR